MGAASCCATVVAGAVGCGGVDKNCSKQAKLSSEATTLASKARALLSKDFIIWANYPYNSDRDGSDSVDSPYGSRITDMITVGLDKELSERPTRRAKEVVGAENGNARSAPGG